jgi:MFS family permease
VILLGLAGHVVGYLLLIPVATDWDFILPSLTHGFGHALLFPCVVSLGAGAFPPEYRGTGTTIILAFVDLGTMLSAPLLGSLIEEQGFTRTYLAMAVFTLATFAVYAALKFRVRDADGAPPAALEPASDQSSAPEPAVATIATEAAAPEHLTCRRA